MINKFIMLSAVSLFIFSGEALLVNNVAFATGLNSSEQESHNRTVPSSLTGTASSDQHLLTLNCLRDSALSIEQIKQQAINIYLEATRKDVQPEEAPVFVNPKSISDKGLHKSAPYLAPRTEWLYFYVGTMEPIIQLFAEDITDTKTGLTKVYVPEAAKKAVTPLWPQWSAGIKDLNEHLTAIYTLANEEKPDNIAIAKNAVEMYKIGNRLDVLREKATNIIRKVYLKGKESTPTRIE